MQVLDFRFSIIGLLIVCKRFLQIHCLYDYDYEALLVLYFVLRRAT